MARPVETMTVVLPLRMAGGPQASDLDRALRFLFPSFQLFWRRPRELSFLVVVPPDELRIVKRQLARVATFPVRLLSEDVLCPTLRGQSGWYKQQIVKLAAAQVVSSPWYLTLDADVVLRRPAALQDLFPGGKPVFKQLAARYHWDWWEASGSILRSSVTFDPDTLMMGVTPEILRRDVVLDLLAEIGRRNHAQDAQRFLFDSRKRGWTEYSLYWLFVLEKEVDELYSRSLRGFYEGVWSAEQLGDHAYLDRAFGPDCEAFFLVLQSNLGLALDDVQRLIESHIPLRPGRLDGSQGPDMFGPN